MFGFTCVVVALKTSHFAGISPVQDEIPAAGQLFPGMEAMLARGARRESPGMMGKSMESQGARNDLQLQSLSAGLAGQRLSWLVQPILARQALSQNRQQYSCVVLFSTSPFRLLLASAFLLSLAALNSSVPFCPIRLITKHTRIVIYVCSREC
ncbi:hypothetical protein Bbelb_442200 [Branchiostoma belcheri]|nr:hypothetical protein Bbelb_442200 [Branchiostoma belcheri]